MVNITNNHNISLALAVWLMADDYDYVTVSDGTKYISVTTLMKPLRQIILARRVPAAEQTEDLADRIARRVGHAFHDSIERSWKHQHADALKKLGYSDKIIERVLINPTDDELRAHPNPIPVYLEQRGLRKINGWTIGGKFDMVAEGIVEDTKSTSAWTWVKGTKDADHQLQGSLYRWIHPDKITADFMRVNFIFTDWQKSMSKTTPNYPETRLKTKELRLLDVDHVHRWIEQKLSLIDRYLDAPEDQIPECTDEELWRSETVYKYFSDPSKAHLPGARATKNFTDLAEASLFKHEKGDRGIVITVPGEPKACGYCNAFPVCSQKDKYQ